MNESKKQTIQLALAPIIIVATIIAVHFLLRPKPVKPYVPKFTIGQCLDNDLSNEFQKKIYQEAIVKVGKREYMAYVYSYNNAIITPGFFNSENMQSIDENSKEISCEPLKKLLRKEHGKRHKK